MFRPGLRARWSMNRSEKIAAHWPTLSRIYIVLNSAQKWMPLLPFLHRFEMLQDCPHLPCCMLIRTGLQQDLAISLEDVRTVVYAGMLPTRPGTHPQCDRWNREDILGASSALKSSKLGNLCVIPIGTSRKHMETESFWCPILRYLKNPQWFGFQDFSTYFNPFPYPRARFGWIHVRLDVQRSQWATLHPRTPGAGRLLW